METRLDEIPMEPACIARHIGPWMVQTSWLSAAVAAAKEGYYAWRGLSVAHTGGPEFGILYSVDNDGIATIPVAGPMMKADSKHGGTNTLRTRRAIRLSAVDTTVKARLMLIDSPGGTVAGAGEVADDARTSNAIKPIYAHIEGTGASAAYWLASQARRVTATPTSEIGSIGTVAVVEDSSEAASMAGIRVHVISSGAHKGEFIEGAPVTEEQLTELQVQVNAVNAHFLEGVKSGRNMPIAKVRAVADGRVFIAAKAREMGLIDDVATIDEAIKMIQRDLRGAERRQAEAQRRTSESERRRQALEQMSP